MVCEPLVSKVQFFISSYIYTHCHLALFLVIAQPSLDVIKYLEGAASPLEDVRKEELFYLFCPGGSAAVYWLTDERMTPLHHHLIILPYHKPLSDTIPSITCPFVAQMNPSSLLSSSSLY